MLPSPRDRRGLYPAGFTIAPRYSGSKQRFKLHQIQVSSSQFGCHVALRTNTQAFGAYKFPGPMGQQGFHPLTFGIDVNVGNSPRLVQTQ
jgi:hypothetical protein